ncbi:sulfide:quinone oxidoreductase [Desulfotomaculum arcticum]|uniref:Sulfide:quinone oxidoreductase n=2 Tax=Desulfotruncus TaxID=2867377 RepID=A0A1I2YHB3_9FIRM|nr:sulfide:quinone oxidoreductase [Desulfotomaculum arcticum] [Desulfotruncus arcticus DSM 17038]
MAAARTLQQGLSDQHKVILIEQHSELYFQPSLLWLMVGRRKILDITRKTRQMQASSASVICSEARTVNISKKTVKTTDDQTFSFDQLILATGAMATKANTKELASAGYNLYTVDGALAINSAIKSFRGGEIVLVVTSLPHKCPPAVYEAAFLLKEWFSKAGNREDVNISIHTPEVIPLQQAGTKVGQALSEKLQKQKINLYTEQRFKNVDPVQQIIHFESGEVPYDLLIYIPRHVAPEVISDSGLADETGWISVDPFTLETCYKDIYAIGDVNHILLPSGLAMPKAGAFAHFQSQVVADNILKKLEHKPPARFFGGKSACMIETGSTAFALWGNLYKQNPSFIVLPENRFWLSGKWFVERVWLYEHS